MPGSGWIKEDGQLHGTARSKSRCIQILSQNKNRLGGQGFDRRAQGCRSDCTDICDRQHRIRSGRIHPRIYGKRIGCDDVLAAFEHVRNLPNIDQARIGVMGSSFGGVNTLLAAARESRFRCAVEFAGAAMNWDRNETIAAYMLEQARKVSMPIFFIQAANDFSVRPTQEIAAALAGTKVRFEARIYPAFGHTQHEGHFLAGRGAQVWGPDVRRFLEQHL